MRPLRLILWPFIFLYILADVLREMIFRFHMLFTCTALWTLGNKKAMALVCEFLEMKIHKTTEEIKKMGGE